MHTQPIQSTCERTGWQGLLLSLLVFLCGCSLGRAPLDQTLLARKPVHDDRIKLVEGYLVRCPDVLEIRVEGRNEWSGRRALGADGRIDLGSLGQVRVEGQTTLEIGRQIAAKAGLTPEKVQVAVAQYNSQQLYLYGEAEGFTRTVPYQGPETVLECLQRVGGITSGAAPADVQVIRAHVADGRSPEIFHIDLHAILLKNEQQTNPRLQPFDQIHVGQSRKSSLLKCIPPWLRPLYQELCGLSRPKHR